MTAKRERAARAALKSQAARNRRRHYPDNREPSTRGMAIASGGCWCGEPFGHDWAGKADGASHPPGLRYNQP